MTSSCCLPLILALTLAAPVSSQSRADDWPDYRGPRHDGHSAATGLPLEWSESENVAWKTAIHGRAWSSPVVAGGEVWLTSATPDGRELSVLCVDVDDGGVVWDERLFEVEVPQYCHPFNTYASPSPVIEGDRLWVTFGAPGTACIDRSEKRTLWTRTDLECNHFRAAGSSPLVFEDLLVLTMDGSDHQYVIALDKETGETKWRTDRSTEFGDEDPETGEPAMEGDYRKGFSTPVVVEVGGEPQLISPGAKAAFAYDPRTGEELWTVRYQQHSSASRTVWGHGLVFVNTGYSNPEVLAIDPTGRGDVTETHVRWRLKRRVPKKPAPLLIGDHLYLLSDGGIASCVVAQTGEPVWHGRVDGEYSSSLLYADGRIWGFSQDGKTVVLAPGPEFEVLAENQLDGGFMASPAVVDRALILRTETHLYRVEERPR